MIRVIQSDDLKKLEMRANKYIERGWKFESLVIDSFKGWDYEGAERVYHDYYITLSKVF